MRWTFSKSPSDSVSTQLQFNLHTLHTLEQHITQLTEECRPLAEASMAQVLRTVTLSQLAAITRTRRRQVSAALATVTFTLMAPTALLCCHSLQGSRISSAQLSSISPTLSWHLSKAPRTEMKSCLPARIAPRLARGTVSAKAAESRAKDILPRMEM